MIDDGQALRESQPHGAARPDDRRDIDGLAAFTTKKPAVTVMVKKRRGGVQGVRVPQDGRPLEEKRPRVHQIHNAASAAGHAQPALAAERASHGQATEPDPHAVIEAWPTRRRRARRDPTHAPGQVTRTVFETPAARPVAPQAAPQAPQYDFIERAEVGYEQVMASLHQLRADLDLALSARKFRIE
jgi:hypothetical protein